MRPPSAAQSRAVAVAPAPRGCPVVACLESIARGTRCLLLTHTSITRRGPGITKNHAFLSPRGKHAPGARRRRAHERGDRNSDPELEQNLRGHRRDSETDRELARKHRTSSAGHEAIDRADGPRSYPLTRSRMGPAREIGR